MSSADSSPRRGYPLAALFLVITASGIVAALVGPALRAVSEGRVGTRDAIFAGAGCGMAVMLLGGVIGLFHFHRLRGFVWGIMTGGAIGIFIGPLVIAPRDSLGTILGLSLGGTIVVVFVTAAYRLAGRDGKC